MRKVDNDLFWREFLKSNPDRAAAVEEGREIVLAVTAHFEQQAVSAQQIDERYRSTIRAARRDDQPLRVRRSIVVYRVAAAILLLIVGGYGILKFGFTEKGDDYPLAYHTDFGEQRLVTLPDGSSVRLNADSELTLGQNWSEANDREVWLNGEAYFFVEKKTGTAAKFTVHVGELNVEVLGTQFNVNARTEITRVVLDEGKIGLYSTGDSTRYMMTPGEAVSIDQSENAISEIANVDPKTSSSWKDGYLLYKDSPLGDVIQDIRYTFGYTPVVRDSLLLETAISGALSATDFEDLLLTLEDVLPRISFTVEDQRLIIDNKDNK